MDLRPCPACGGATFDLHLTARGYCNDCEASGQAEYDLADRAGLLAVARSFGG